MSKKSLPPEFFAVIGMLCGAAFSLIYVGVEFIKLWIAN